MKGYYEQLVRLLREHGYRQLPGRGKGSHEVWSNASRHQIIPRNCNSRHTAKRDPETGRHSTAVLMTPGSTSLRRGGFIQLGLVRPSAERPFGNTPQLGTLHASMHQAAAAAYAAAGSP
jgi:hypothetical protein